MQRKLSLLIAVVLCVTMMAVTVAAQSKSHFGFRAGVNMANMGGDATDNVDTKTKTGLTFGGFFEYDLTENMAVRPEVNFIQKGVEKEYTEDLGMESVTVTEDVKLSYIEIPVLFKFNIPTNGKIKPALYAGPALSINMSGKDEITGYGEGFDGDLDITNMKSTDFSGVVGGGVGFPLGKMMGFIDVRYDMSFGTAFEDMDDTDVPEGEVAFVKYDSEGMMTTEAEDLKNKGFSIAVGIEIPIGQ